MSEFKEAMAIVEDYAMKMGWVFEHDLESVDLFIAVSNMVDMEENDELPCEVRPAYRVVYHSFSKLFANQI